MTRHSVLFLACLIASVFFAACTADLAVRKDQAETSRRIGEGYLGEGNVNAALAELLKAEKLCKGYCRAFLPSIALAELL